MTRRRGLLREVIGKAQLASVQVFAAVEQMSLTRSYIYNWLYNFVNLHRHAVFTVKLYYPFKLTIDNYILQQISFW